MVASFAAMNAMPRPRDDDEKTTCIAELQLIEARRERKETDAQLQVPGFR